MNAQLMFDLGAIWGLCVGGLGVGGIWMIRSVTKKGFK